MLFRVKCQVKRYFKNSHFKNKSQISHPSNQIRICHFSPGKEKIIDFFLRIEKEKTVFRF